MKAITIGSILLKAKCGLDIASLACGRVNSSNVHYMPYIPFRTTQRLVMHVPMFVTKIKVVWHKKGILIADFDLLPTCIYPITCRQQFVVFTAALIAGMKRKDRRLSQLSLDGARLIRKR